MACSSPQSSSDAYLEQHSGTACFRFGSIAYKPLTWIELQDFGLKALRCSPVSLGILLPGRFVSCTSSEGFWDLGPGEPQSIPEGSL